MRPAQVRELIFLEISEISKSEKRIDELTQSDWQGNAGGRVDLEVR